MRYAFSVANSKELDSYQAFLARNQVRIEEYINYLKANFQVEYLPEFVVLSNCEMATKVHSSIIIPAYTNEVRTVLAPDVDVWKDIYLKQLEAFDGGVLTEGIRDYYSNCLSENHILQIVGHELVHHSELFMEDFDSDMEEGIWFEEGMAEYISSHYFLTPDEIEQSNRIEAQLIALFEDKYGASSIESFGQLTYDGSYASVFYNYWRSNLTVERLVTELGTVNKVFEKYHEWFANGEASTLAQWFGLE